MRKASVHVNEVDAIIAAKENAIVDLYAKRSGVSIAVAKKKYMGSKLQNVIRDIKTTLYLESPYFILDRYSEYMVPARANIVNERKMLAKPRSFKLSRKPSRKLSRELVGKK